MEYIDVKTREFFEVELLGIRALFTKLHIDKSSVPEGMYCYHLRHDRFPSTVENEVRADYFGTILTTKRLNFGAGDFLPLGHGDFDFTDKKFHVHDFMKKYSVQNRTTDKPEENLCRKVMP